MLRTPAPDALLEPVTVGPDEFADTAAEFARSVQIVSRLPDQLSTGAKAVGFQVGENHRVEPSLSRGDRYERTYELRAAAGEDVHGEANFVTRFSPGSVLDAGCGTGRVGRELHRRGVDVVGVDLDAEMLETARARCLTASWIEGDISTIHLGRTFDIVLMAGNVINFVIPEFRRQALENLVHHLRPAGLLINGHSIRPEGCPPSVFAIWAEAAGLEPVERWSTWDQDAFADNSDYALTVHRLRA